MNLAPDDRITYLGRTNHRGSDQLFGIRQPDRRMHMLILGKTGTGKSHLLRLIASQDVVARRGLALFDPHGDLAGAVRQLAADRPDDMIYVDLTDSASRWRFNPFAGIPPDARSLAASGIVSVFKKLWTDDWGPRLEHLLRNVAFALLETEGSTFGDVPSLLLDRSYRTELIRGLTNSVVRDFWENEFDKYTSGLRAVAIAPLQNKVGALLTDPVLRRFFTDRGEQLDLRRIMDEGRILVVNLDKGRLGEDSAILVGSMLLSHLALAGLGRADVQERDRRDFLVVLDEFQLFATHALANMLAELRKYRVSVTMATQYLSAVDPVILASVLGNVGSMIAFRVGAADATALAREFGAPLEAADFTGLPRHHIYVRLLIDGEPSKPFSAVVPWTL